jgi:GT2 family glycosyltransferase
MAAVEKNASPRCSVLVVNWNSWDLLDRCLEALGRQSYSDFRVVVADNASAGGVPEGFREKFSGVAFIENAANLGFAAANNRLIELCRDSEWIALLNPDAFPEKDWLKSLMEAAYRADSATASFASRLVMADDPGLLDGDGDVYHVSGIAVRAGHGRPATARSRPAEVFGACAAAALYRRAALEEVGGFDEDFFCYFEDVDLSFRLRLAGYRCLLVPSAVVRHVGSATSGGQDSDFAVYYGHRNLVWTFVKNMPGVLFWLFLPGHLALNVIALLLFWRRGRGRPMFRAKRDALKGIPAVLAKRRDVQKARRVGLLDLLRILDKGNPARFLKSRPARSRS